MTPADPRRSSGPRATHPACLSTAISRSSALTLSHLALEPKARLYNEELRPGGVEAPIPIVRPSCRRELMPSLVNTLRRCHSTVRRLRNSRAPISGFESPSRGQQPDLPLLCGQIVARLDGPRRTFSPVARRSLGRARRTPPCRSPPTSRGPCAVAHARRPGGSRGATTRRRPAEHGRARDAAGSVPVSRWPRDAGARRSHPRSKSARQRACIPRPQSVSQDAVAAITRSSAPAATLGVPRADRRFDQLGRRPRGDVEQRCLPRPRVGPTRAPGRSGPVR